MKALLIAEGNRHLSTARYRAFNRAHQMSKAGWDVKVWIGFDPKHWWKTDPPRTMWEDVPGRTVIVQRVPYNRQNGRAFERLKREADRVGYDVDDLIFNLDLLPEHTGLTQADCRYYHRGLQWADFLTCSTPELQAELQARYPDKPVYVLPNVVGQLLGDAAQRGRVTRPNTNRITLGYASGTAAHKDDFAMVLPVVDKLMSNYDHVDFAIIGTLPLPREFKHKWLVAARLQQWPFVTYDALPFLVRGLFDINLVPLTDTRFNQCKSLVKWLEAALFEVPSVCSQIGRFKALPSGTAYSATDEKEWTWFLDRLISDRHALQEMGKAARKHALDVYTYRNSTPLECLPR